MPLKKKGKKKTKTRHETSSKNRDVVMADDVPLPPKPMERLVNLLKQHPVDEKELFGIKVSTKALEKLTPQEILDLRVVFEALDLHGRGSIGPVEVRRAMRALGFKVNREQARQMVEDASCRGMGVLDFNEFLELVIGRQADSRNVYDEILQGFRLFDCDDREKISLENLTQAAKEAGLKLGRGELEDMMEEADRNGDGFVDKEEFMKIMLQTNLF